MPVIFVNKPAILFRILILVFLFSCNLSYAGVYKWTDEDGTVHYSDKPLNKDSKKFHYNPQVIDQKTFQQGVHKKQGHKTALPEDNGSDGVNLKKPYKKTEKHLRYCHEARDDLKFTEESQLLYNYDEHGKRYFLNEKQRQAAIKKKKKLVKKWCD